MSDSFLAKLKAGTNNQKTIKWPGTEEDVKIRVLSDADLQLSRLNTARYFQEQGFQNDISIGDAYEAEESTQGLYLALCTPDGSLLTATIDEFRKLITGPEKDVLAEEYNNLEKECSPVVSKMTQTEFDVLIEDVKKKPELVVGNISNFSTAKQLIISLVSQLVSSQTDNGSISREC